MKRVPIVVWCCLLAAGGVASAQPSGGEQSHRRALSVGVGPPTSTATTTATSQPATASRPATSQPGEWAAVLAAAREFQPGLRIDWQHRQVLVAGRIVLRKGPLEYFACRPGKEHESIVVVEPTATHVYMALGLVGLNPGRPPRWDEGRQRWIAPTGDQVDVLVLYRQEGRWRCADAWEWMLTGDPLHTPLSQPWVFSGSVAQPDGQLAADRDGDFIAVVDKPLSLLCLADAHSDANDQLWCVANPGVIPPVGTRVWLVLRAARARDWVVRLCPGGELTIDGQPITVERLATLLKRRWQLTERRRLRILASSRLYEQARELRCRLVAAGAPQASFSILITRSSATRPAQR